MSDSCRRRAFGVHRACPRLRCPGPVVGEDRPETVRHPLCVSPPTKTSLHKKAALLRRSPPGKLVGLPHAPSCTSKVRITSALTSVRNQYGAFTSAEFRHPNTLGVCPWLFVDWLSVFHSPSACLLHWVSQSRRSHSHPALNFGRPTQGVLPKPRLLPKQRARD